MRQHKILTFSLVIILVVSFSVLQPVHAAGIKLNALPYFDSDGNYIYFGSPVYFGITDNFASLVSTRPSTPTNGYYFSNIYPDVVRSLRTDNSAHYSASSDNYFSGFYKPSYSLNYPSGWNYLYPLLDQSPLDFSSGSEYILSCFELIKSCLISFGYTFDFTLLDINNWFHFVNSSDVSVITRYFDEFFNPHIDFSRELGTYRLGAILSFYEDSNLPNQRSYKITLYRVNAYTPSTDDSVFKYLRTQYGYTPPFPYLGVFSLTGNDLYYSLVLPRRYMSSGHGGTSSTYLSNFSELIYSCQMYAAFNSYGSYLTSTNWDSNFTYVTGTSPVYFYPLATRGLSNSYDCPVSMYPVITPYNLYYAGFLNDSNSAVVSTPFGYANKVTTYYSSGQQDYYSYRQQYSLLYDSAKRNYGVWGSYTVPLVTPTPTPSPTPIVTPDPTSTPTPLPTLPIAKPTDPPWNQPTAAPEPWQPSVAPNMPTYIPIIITQSPSGPTPTVAPVTGFSFDWHFDSFDVDRTSDYVFDSDVSVDDFDVSWFDVIFNSLGQYRNLLIIPAVVGLAVYVVRRWM